MFFFCDVSHQLLFTNLQRWSLTGGLQMMFVGLDTLKTTKSLFWCHCIVRVYSTYSMCVTCTVFMKGINPQDRKQGHYKHLPYVT